ncbi:Uncharacterized protein APZ42_007555 [Daphnia magna]|uniref:Uncharacterized protein n=1 Tax=Daphnia magna TaxID=35525 RepID=A0A164F7Z7_9CRUS|nr:Uncharacterized protein APZ42_007555 [Daphnia magna]
MSRWSSYYENDEYSKHLSLEKRACWTMIANPSNSLITQHGREAGLMSTSSAVKTCTSSYSRYQTLESRSNKEQSQQLLPVKILKPIGAIRRDPMERISKVSKNLLVEHREFLTWTSVFDRLGNKIRH